MKKLFCLLFLTCSTLGFSNEKPLFSPSKYYQEISKAFVSSLNGNDESALIICNDLLKNDLSIVQRYKVLKDRVMFLQNLKRWEEACKDYNEILFLMHDNPECWAEEEAFQKYINLQRHPGLS